MLLGVYLLRRYIYITFMHLADAFIQSDLQLHSGYTFSLVYVFPGNWTHSLLRCWRNALPLSHTGTRYVCVLGKTVLCLSAPKLCNFSSSRHVSKSGNLIGWIVFDAARQTKKTNPRRLKKNDAFMRGVFRVGVHTHIGALCLVTRR